MAPLKFIFPVFTELFKKHPDLISAIHESQNAFRAAIREEALAITLRVMGALILCAVIIYSLVAVGQQVNILLLNMEMGPYISMASFGALALVALAILYFGFRSRTPVKRPQSEPIDLGIDFQKIMLNFLDGVNEGFDEAAQKKHDRTPAKNSDISADTTIPINVGN